MWWLMWVAVGIFVIGVAWANVKVAEKYKFRAEDEDDK